MSNEPKDSLTPVSVRKKTGLTQAQAAALLDVRAATCGDWENNRTVPHLTPSKWLLWLRATGLTPEQLVEAYEPDQLKLIDVKLQAFGLN